VTFAAGILALATVAGTCAAKYQEYFGDPDVWNKIIADIMGNPEMKHYTENAHENRLYEFLVHGSEEEFKEELKKESAWFRERYHVPDDPPLVEFDMRLLLFMFEDYETLFAYVQGKTPFLKESLKRGYFLDAYVLAKRINSKKASLLLKEAYIQGCHTGFPVIRIDEEFNYGLPDTKEVADEVSAIIDNIVMLVWVLRLSHHFEEIQRWKGKDILQHFGETKKRFFDLARARYHEIVVAYPELKQDDLAVILD